MRWLIACAFVVVATTSLARAKIVIMEPTVASLCPRAKSWDGVEKCLKKIGGSTLLRTLPEARLVSVIDRPGGTTVTALALYVQRGKEWILGGLYEARGSEFELLDAATLVVGKHTGYRIEIGDLGRIAISLDGATTVAALLAKRQVLLCGGENYRCTEITTSCDLFVRGGALWSFHGAYKIVDNNTVLVVGDRRIGGSTCAVPEKQFLGWEQP
jgi:hypothetical protein